jgi:hypothetical protein
MLNIIVAPFITKVDVACSVSFSLNGLASSQSISDYLVLSIESFCSSSGFSTIYVGA